MTQRSAASSVAWAAERAGVRWRFGPFLLWEAQRRLERDGQPVRIGSRALDLLLQLLQRAGEVVGKDELLAAVWSDVVVDEGSVRVHMSTLRKALGAPGEADGCRQWIANIPLRGYRFLGQVERELAQARPDEPDDAKPLTLPSLPELPLLPSRLVGRDDEVERVLTVLAKRRLVTIVGAGGIGKTRIAVRVAQCHRAQHASRAGFVDLTPLAPQDEVASATARALGLGAGPDAVQAIVRRLAGMEVLLVIDNCEHVVESMAVFAAGLLAALPRLRILATSREALRVEGEYVVRLSALELPADEASTLADALRSPAVELFVERAQAAGAHPFDDSHAGALVRICRQTDGIALAIELVAARLGAQSIDDLAARLDDHMRLHSAGNRDAHARHRTLAAALDWSIALLDAAELRLFRRLSVFRGNFDVEAALALSRPDMPPEAALDALVSLAGKSLVAFDAAHVTAPYRLLDTTRSYAHLLLAQCGEQEAHAGHAPSK